MQWRRLSGGWGEKVKGLRTPDQQLQNSHRDVKYGVGNRVSTIIVATYGARGMLETSGDHSRFPNHLVP